jgi:hypothetical protein
MTQSGRGLIEYLIILIRGIEQAPIERKNQVPICRLVFTVSRATLYSIKFIEYYSLLNMCLYVSTNVVIIRC